MQNWIQEVEKQKRPTPIKPDPVLARQQMYEDRESFWLPVQNKNEDKTIALKLFVFSSIVVVEHRRNHFRSIKWRKWNQIKDSKKYINRYSTF